MKSEHKKYEESYMKAHNNQIAQTNDKDKILKTDREKRHVKYRRTKIRVATDYSSEKMKGCGISMFSELEVICVGNTEVMGRA